METRFIQGSLDTEGLWVYDRVVFLSYKVGGGGRGGEGGGGGERDREREEKREERGRQADRDLSKCTEFMGILSGGATL